MIRRKVLIVAAAAALVLAPSAAFGYGAQDYTNKGTVSDSTPATGESFSVTVQGPGNTPVTLTVTSNPASLPDSAITIAGTKTLTKTTNAAGTAVFTVTVVQPGTYTLVAADAASGAVLSTQSLTVAGAAGAARGALPTTGSDALPLGLGAGALVLAGAGAVVVAKRRRGVTAA
jgi:LPXTG-motif cell wall-anchored protein